MSKISVLMMIMMIIIITIFIIVYTNYVEFLDKEEITGLLMTNDAFYSTFFEKDLEARGVSSIAEYKKKVVAKSGSSFTWFDKIKLAICARKADKRLRIKNIESVEWRIGCVDNSAYESGLPHTLSNTIVLTRDIMETYSMKELENTLIHEKVHLYQKRYPEEVDAHLKSRGFTRTRKREKDDSIRANPDTDDMIWIHQPSGDVYKAEYREHPKSVSDIVSQQIKEHPYEMMAIEAENKDG